jgi:hypothetical protein
MQMAAESLYVQGRNLEEINGGAAHFYPGRQSLYQQTRNDQQGPLSARLVRRGSAPDGDDADRHQSESQQRAVAALAMIDISASTIAPSGRIRNPRQR